MTAGRILRYALFAVALLVGYFIVRHLSFTEVSIRVPLKGEALRNPFYAAIKLSEELGAEAEWQRVFTMPRRDAVILLADWNWTLSRARRERLQRWVENGGRLVVDDSMIGDRQAFEDWSGIALDHQKSEPGEEPEADADAAFIRDINDHECRPLAEEGTKRTFSVCDIPRAQSLVTHRKILWALRDDKRLQAIRTAVGDGSVTVIDASPFRFREIFQGDHARLFVALTQLHRGDALLFLTEEDHPSIVSLAWSFGAPAIVILIIAIAFALWRSIVRFGPKVPPTDIARRSLAEQIRGTGQFVLRFGGGRALHAATVRALRDAAVRRFPAYDRLSAEERVTTLARATGVAEDDLRHSLNFTGSRGSHELRTCLAVLEAARRRIPKKNQRSNHGN